MAAIGRSGLVLDEVRAQAAVIWLPSTDRAPLASSGLIADPPDNLAGATLRAWTVSAIALQWPAAIELLCLCAGRTTIAPGVIVGEDLTYWVAAMRLAARIVARQQFLPALVKQDDAWIARWRPAPDHRTAQEIALLAAAMPDVCRAAGEGGTPPAVNAADILSAFVEGVVDGLARAFEESNSPAAASFDSADAQWLHALGARQPRLGGDSAALEQLRDRVRSWWRPVALGAASPFRLCFRLEEPEAVVTDTGDTVLYDSSAERPWRLRYLLQAHHDPSLIVTASQAWSARGREAAQIARDGFEVREFLLRSLGEAARICPPIQDSLRGGIPDAHELDTSGAAQFLTEYAGGLEQAGFGIVLPASWSSKGTRLRLTARAKVKSPRMTAGAGLSLGDLIDVDWEAALGDRTLSADELRALARLKTPLVKMRGQWVLLNAQEIREAIDRLRGGPRKLPRAKRWRWHWGARRPMDWKAVRSRSRDGSTSLSDG